MKALCKDNSRFVLFYAWFVLLLYVVQVINMASTTIPPGFFIHWNAYQWSIFRFYWDSFPIELLQILVVTILAFKKRYIVFVISLLINFHVYLNSFFSLKEILLYGFVYPIDNSIGILILVQFLCTIAGTILWLRNIFHHDGKWWH